MPLASKGAFGMEHRFLMKKERRFLMEQISITFTSNTGLLMQYGDTKVLFDSLYGKSGHRFSPLPQVLEQEIMEGAGDFSEIDYLVFSHNHADHFSAKYLKAYLQQNTVKGIFLPEDLLQETDLMEFLKAEKIPTMFFSKNPRLNRTIVLGKSFRLRAIPKFHIFVFWFLAAQNSFC